MSSHDLPATVLSLVAADFERQLFKLSKFQRMPDVKSENDSVWNDSPAARRFSCRRMFAMLHADLGFIDCSDERGLPCCARQGEIREIAAGL